MYALQIMFNRQQNTIIDEKNYPHPPIYVSNFIFFYFYRYFYFLSQLMFFIFIVSISLTCLQTCSHTHLHHYVLLFLIFYFFVSSVFDMVGMLASGWHVDVGRVNCDRHG